MPITIAEYDSRWPSLYEEEKGRVLCLLGDVVLDIQHVGSTAVPGLGAKPIIDIMVAVADLADVEKCIEPLATLGYEFRGEAGVPGRLFFGKGAPRTHNLHVVEREGDVWKNALLFRDFLRAHPDEARQYYELKKRLAAQYGAGRDEYWHGKRPFIESLLAKARAAARKGP
jgi:GrpB-like predicted nucleotidyltransferase (UPF0157 family)